MSSKLREGSGPAKALHHLLLSEKYPGLPGMRANPHQNDGARTDTLWPLKCGWLLSILLVELLELSVRG